MPEIRGIAAEELIGTLAAENHLHVLPGGAGQEERWQDGWIGDRLRHVLDDTREGFAKRFLIRPYGYVLRTDAPGQHRGIAALVVGLLGELGRKRVHPVDPDKFRSQRCKDGGVEAAADEDADGHVAHHLFLDCPLYQPLQLRNGLAWRARLNGKRGRIPIANELLTAVAEARVRSSRDAPYIAKHRARLRHVAEGEVLAEGDRVELAGDPRMLEDALQCRGEQHLATYPGIEQRLLAGPVARQQEHAGAVIPDAETEHAIELTHGIGTAGQVERKNRLDVALGAVRVVGELGADVECVVDLAIALQPDLLAGRGEGLVGPLVQVDDAQPLRAKDGVGVGQRSPAIRAAVTQCLAHEVENLGMAQDCAALRDHAVDAAHQRRIVYATK